jgi:hypothetical protein
VTTQVAAKAEGKPQTATDTDRPSADCDIETPSVSAEEEAKAQISTDDERPQVTAEQE